ncbi:MAG: DUF1540 domain-containing protein [Clostridiaceae bacterium]
MGCCDSPRMQVKCRVENCHYSKSRMCHADSLEVNAMCDGKADKCPDLLYSLL